MAKEFYTVEVISHLENETGEYDYVPTFEVRINKGGKEKPSARLAARIFQISSTSRTSSIYAGSICSTHTASSSNSTIPAS